MKYKKAAPMEFLWYGYESGGKDARRDRPVQFSSLRTDHDLKPIGDPVELFCRPALDYLQQPKASLVHGHSIAKQRRRGVVEAEFARRIYEEFSRPTTCIVGYNAFRYDHVVTQFLFYRNLRDPYAWHKKGIGNSKWAIIDLVRAAYALRPDILRWPLGESGQPSFTLSQLAEKNNLASATHDASAGVRAMIGLAGLIRRRRPGLFNHYLKLRDIEEVAKAVSGSFLWVSGYLGNAHGSTRLMAPVYVSDDLRDVLAVDLAHDPARLLNCTDEELKSAVLTGDNSFHLYRIKTDTCPFVFPCRLDGPREAGLLTSKTADRLKLDAAAIRCHYAMLKADSTITDRIRTVYGFRGFKDEQVDVDYALSSGFIGLDDRQKLDRMLSDDPECSSAADLIFEDERLPELVFRYRARNYFTALSQKEKERWLTHCRACHLTLDDDGKTAMDRLDEAIEKERVQQTGRAQWILDDLQRHGARLKKWLQSARLDAIDLNTPRVGIGHLFTTGGNPKTDRILHVVGERLFVGDRVPEAREWVLHTHRHITKRLFEMTRLGGSVFNKAPTWREAKSDVADFFAELDVLFVFDADRQVEWFSQVILEGEVDFPVLVDLMEMGKFFLPAAGLLISEHDILDILPQERRVAGASRLSTVVRGLRFLLERIISVIQADSDKYRVYDLLQRALAASDPPKDFLALLRVAEIASGICWDESLRRVLLSEPVSGVAENTPSQQDSELSLLATGETESEESTTAKGSSVKRMSLELIDQWFRALPKHFEGFKERTSQREFAKFCAEAMNKGGLYAAEAGTGTGKTMGYLIAASEFLRLNSSLQVIVASSTKNLIMQIIEEDFGRLLGKTTKYRGIRTAVLKGKNNYLCTTALFDLLESDKFKTGSASDRLAWLYLFMLWRYADGRWDGVPGGRLRTRFGSLPEFAKHVNAVDACIPGVCNLGGWCVYPQALERAQHADLIVTNHHKLALLDLGPFSSDGVCVIDEADQFADNTRSALTKNLTQSALARFIRGLRGSPTRRSWLRNLERRLQAAASDSDSDDIRKRLEHVLSECQAMDRHSQSIDGAASNERVRTARHWKTLSKDCTVVLQKALIGIAESAGRIASELDEISKSSRYDPAQRKERTQSDGRTLADELRRVLLYKRWSDEMASTASSIASSYPSDDVVHVFESSGSDWTIDLIPFNITSVMDDLQKSLRTVILTSATLYVDDSLNFLSGELGRHDESSQLFDNDHAKQFSSPFAFDKQVGGVVMTDNVLYNYRQFKLDHSLYDQWKSNIARGIAVLSVATYGRTLVLFTNQNEMEDIFAQVAPVLRDYDIVPLLQCGQSHAEIERFRRVEYSVLFGVNRFWTGADFKGKTLSQVVIVRLPIPNSFFPLNRHRYMLYKDRYWSIYGDRVVKFRMQQGFGRLIRGEKEAGLFVVLDQRLKTDSRMEHYQEAVPISMAREVSEVSVAKQGLRFLGLTPEFNDRSIDLEEVERRF